MPSARSISPRLACPFCLILVFGTASLFSAGHEGRADEPPGSSQPSRPEPARAKATPNLEGWYQVEGRTGKTTYRGTACLLRVGDTYLVQWCVTGAPQTMGVGTHADGRFIVGWAVQGSGLTHGVSVYRVQGQLLKGSWVSLPGDGGHHPETLRFLFPLAEPEAEEP